MRIAPFLFVLTLAGCASGPQLAETDCPVQVKVNTPKYWKVDAARIRMALAERGYRVVEKDSPGALLLEVTGHQNGGLSIAWTDPHARPKAIPASLSVGGGECAGTALEAEACGLYQYLAKTALCEN